MRLAADAFVPTRQAGASQRDRDSEHEDRFELHSEHHYSNHGGRAASAREHSKKLKVISPQRLMHTSGGQDTNTSHSAAGDEHNTTLDSGELLDMTAYEQPSALFKRDRDNHHRRYDTNAIHPNPNSATTAPVPLDPAPLPLPTAAAAAAPATVPATAGDEHHLLQHQHSQTHINTCTPVSRRHQTVDLSHITHNPTNTTAEVGDAANSSTFMYDAASLRASPSPSPKRRYLDENLSDPCLRHPDDSDDDLPRSEYFSSQPSAPADTSDNTYSSFRSRVATPEYDEDFSREHTPADFARFIAATQLAQQVDNKGNRKVASKQDIGEDEQYQKFVNAMAGIYNLSDQQLEDRFLFEQEIGFGNWGSVWQCRLREPPVGPNGVRSSPGSRLGRAAAMNGGLGAAGRVAVKLAHRGKEAANTQRVHALWHEMKIIRSLRHDTHPSIIEFEAFVITPGYALIVMPFHSHLIECKISVQRARPYFRALASAVGYLHERGITHNDIKPANIVMTYNDVPVLVDFGFAKKHELGSPGRFLSTVRMGTPEYLDPQRVVGQPHDERASDVWSLGVTFYEILIGRTPFEYDENEVFVEEDLPEYWSRTRAGAWLGDWEMPPMMESLLHYMICPDPIHRISALTAYHHPALQPSKESLNPGTPYFIREAVYEPDDETEEAYEDMARARRLKAVKSDVGAIVRKKKKRDDRQVTPLGESIKQHTSADQLRLKVSPKRAKPNVTRVRTQTQKAQRATHMDKENRQPSDCESPGMGRPSSARALLTNMVDVVHTDDLEVSTISQPDFGASPIPAKSRDEAMQRTMGFLEGNNVAIQQTRQVERVVAEQHEVIPQASFETAPNRAEAVNRALKALEGKKKNGSGQTLFEMMSADKPFSTVPLRSPAQSRPHTLDAGQALSNLTAKNDLRRSAHSEHLSSLVDDSPSRPVTPHTPVRNSRLGSTAPMLDVNISTGSIFPPSLSRPRDAVALQGGSPLRGHGNAPGRDGPIDASPARRAKQSTAPDAVGQKEDNLDRLAEWAKSIENYVDIARRARAEGRAEPAMPPMIEEHFHTMGLRAFSPVARVVADAVRDEFGEKHIDIPIPEKRGARRERPTVSQLFHRRDSEIEKDKKHTPQVLRRMAARIPTRKSEPFLGATVHLPTVSPPDTLVYRAADDEPMETIKSSWRRSNTSANLLSPPVGYTMLAPPAEPGMTGTARMAKPSSMVSLRDKARALLGGDDRARMAHKASQSLPRSSKSTELLRQVPVHDEDGRPQTPGAHSVFKRKGLFKLFKRAERV